MNYIEKSKLICIKIGSSLLIDEASGKIRSAWLDSLVDDITQLQKSGKKVIIVTSGAIGLGKPHLNLKRQNLTLNEKQAAASIGQIELVKHYKDSFARNGLNIGQILITIDDTEERGRYINARYTLETLLALNIIPVINENDTVATSEIKFGDNDRLAARVSQMINCDCLVLFSDIDGLYNANPKKVSNAEFIGEIREITPEIEQMAGSPISKYGTGGMVTKLQAAKIAMNAGCTMVIADGTKMNPIKNLLDGGRASYFIAKSSPLTAKKNWIANTINAKGEIIINAKAIEALVIGKSLLPVGVESILGSFNAGDTVKVLDELRNEVARGITSYNSSEAAQIIGHQTTEFEGILGYRGPDELLHRNDLVLFINRETKIE